MIIYTVRFSYIEIPYASNKVPVKYIGLHKILVLLVELFRALCVFLYKWLSVFSIYVQDMVKSVIIFLAGQKTNLIIT